MRTGGICLALLLAGLIAGCGRDAALDALADGGVARVAAVSAGDALTLDDGRRVRLAGVAAPQPGEPYAEEARAALQRLAEGREVRLLHGGVRETADGALLAHVRDTEGRRWLQGALLEEGAARVRTGRDDRALVAPMLREEARARAGPAGLWRDPAYQVRLPDEVVAENAVGFRIVEGRVARVAENAGRLYLEFSADWRGGFSAEVPAAAWREFDAAGVDLRGVQQKLVRVRGEVRRTGYGPRLVLDHPEQLERLREP